MPLSRSWRKVPETASGNNATNLACRPRTTRSPGAWFSRGETTLCGSKQPEPYSSGGDKTNQMMVSRIPVVMASTRRRESWHVSPAFNLTPHANWLRVSMSTDRARTGVFINCIAPEHGSHGSPTLTKSRKRLWPNKSCGNIQEGGRPGGSSVISGADIAEGYFRCTHAGSLFFITAQLK